VLCADLVVIDDIELLPGTDGLGDGAVSAVSADQHAEVLQGEPGDAQAGSTAAWPSAWNRDVLPVPEGPQTTKFSRRPIRSNLRRACWVGTGMLVDCSCQTAKVLPVGNPAAVRRLASAERSRPRPPHRVACAAPRPASTAAPLAVARTSGARRRTCGIRSRRSNASTSAGSGGAAGNRRSARPARTPPARASLSPSVLALERGAGRCVVGQDRGEVVLAEPAADRGVPERPVHSLRVARAGWSDHGWRDVAEAGLSTRRQRQLRATIRDAEQETAAVLRRLGWRVQVTPEAEGVKPAETRSG
jgi:hypothetical protein